MWVEFVVGSLLCSERFSGFALTSKTNIAKSQFDLDYRQALYHEPLARVIAQALPVFDVKFTVTFTFFFLFSSSSLSLLSASEAVSPVRRLFHLVSNHTRGNFNFYDYKYRKIPMIVKPPLHFL